MLDITELGRQKRILKAKWRRAAREGVLEFQEGGLVRRPPSEITDEDEISGDLMEPEALWMVSIANPNSHMVGGVVVLARVDLAAQMVTLGVGGVPSHRPATTEEVALEKKAQSDRLNSRIAEARNQSRKEDSKYGKRD